MERTSTADYDERTKTARVWDRETPNATTMSSFTADDVLEAGILVVARGWRMLDDQWSYNPLDGHEIRIARL